MMIKTVLACLCLSLGHLAISQESLPSYPRVLLETTEGNILLELDSRRAPLTVRHFLELVESEQYDGTIFHRVIADFMIQAGGYDRDLKPRETDDTLVNESGNGLPHLRGTIAMARTNEPHSANAQFFINVVDNARLNPRADRWGYAVFGSVIEGMDVADKIAAMRTGPAGNLARDVPVVPIIIEKAVRADL